MLIRFTKSDGGRRVTPLFLEVVEGSRSGQWKSVRTSQLGTRNMDHGEVKVH